MKYTNRYSNRKPLPSKAPICLCPGCFKRVPITFGPGRNKLYCSKYHQHKAALQRMEARRKVRQWNAEKPKRQERLWRGEL